MARFYSVQSQSDAERLANGGKPWPREPMRANLGIGFYSWGTRDDAERYRIHLSSSRGADLQIVAYEIEDGDWAKLRRLDLTPWSDEEVDAWMDRYSRYGDAIPHDLEHITRGTDRGVEHFFAPSAFAKLRVVP